MIKGEFINNKLHPPTNLGKLFRTLSLNFHFTVYFLHSIAKQIHIQGYYVPDTVALVSGDTRV